MHQTTTLILLKYAKIIQLIVLIFCNISLYGQNSKFYLDPEKKLTQYVLEKWNADNGMPFNSIQNIMQTSDGYLIIAAYEGLLRFDGTKFTHFNKKVIPFLRNNRIMSFLELNNKELLLGTTSNGVIRSKDWKFSEHEQLKAIDKPIDIIFQAADGRLLIGTRGAGLFEFKEKLKQINSDKFSNSIITRIIEIEKGKFLIASEGKGLAIYDGNILKDAPYNTDSLFSNKVIALTDKKNGKIWVGTNDGMNYIENDTIKRLYALQGVSCMEAIVDGVGNLWVVSNKGLFRWSEKKQLLEKLTEKEGLPHNDVSSLTFDHEGSLWLSTYKGGLVRLRDGKFRCFTTQDGLISKPVNAIQEIGKDKYLIATDAGTLNILDKNKITSFVTKTVINDRIRNILKDKQGNLWICTYSGVLKVAQDGKEFLLTKENGLPDNQARVVYEDKNGTIWLGFRTGGLLGMFKNGEKILYNKSNGLSSDFIMDVSEDKNGRLFICTNNAGLNILELDGKIKKINLKNGLSSDLAFRAYTDEKNRTWIATDAGLSLLENDKIFTVTSSNGLPVESVYAVLPDKLGNFWLPSNKGVFCIQSKDLFEAAYKKTTSAIKFKLYNRNDGMIDDECTGTAQNCIDSKGRIWFGTFDGVASIDPSQILINQVQPPVLIEFIMLDDEKINILHGQTEIEIPANTKRLVIGFTALSLLAPKKVLFNYQLKGFDPDVIQTNSVREANYTNLSPGTYEFSVIACNNDEVWNFEGANLKIVKLPFFYQTKLFYFLVVLILSVVLYFLYKWRVSAIKKSNMQLERTVELRTAEINLQKEELLAQRDRIDEQKHELERSYSKIKTVSEIGQKVTAVLNFDDLVEMLYTHINTLMKADGFGIGVFNEINHRLDFKGFIENNEKLPTNYDYLIQTDKISVQCFMSKEMILINDLNLFLREKNREFTGEHGKKPLSIIYLPLIIENEVLGVITVQSFQKDAYKEHHIMSFQALASYVAIALANSHSYEIIQSKNQSITDSIRYAMTIQQAILPTNSYLSEHLKEYFIINKPKDIVSGDFYWSNAVGNKIHFAVVDCTGHGVPGAFMSLIGHMILNEIVNVELIHKPHKILTKLDEMLRKALNKKDDISSDGMDIGLCFIQPNDDAFEIAFSGARRPLYYVKSNIFEEIKGSKKSIGGVVNDVVFEANTILLQENDTIYLATDGFADQSDEKRHKFGSHNLKAMIIKYTHLPLKEQQIIYANALIEHQGKTEQRDDITLVGIKL